VSSNKLAVPDGTEFIEHAEALLLDYEKLREVERARMLERDPEDRRCLTIRTAGLVPRRNGLCPCGSGRKYKTCCRLRAANNKDS
jgi:uncharacterized protein YecA (UPF0149 family)